MRCYVLTGDDDWSLRARRDQLVAEAGVAAEKVERYDLSGDGGGELVTSAATFSLFGGARVLAAQPAVDLSADSATRLLATAGDVTVLLYGMSAVPAAVKKILAGQVTFETHKTPTGSAAAQRISELAAAAGVRLDAAARAHLMERAGHDLPRVADVLRQLSSVGIAAPSAAQLDVLLGSSAAAGLPWHVSDAVERGDVAAALNLSPALTPVAAVAYLASRIGQLGRISDDGMSSGQQVAAALGTSSPAAGQKLLAVARRLGRGGIAASWDVVAAADRRVKVGGDPHAELDLLLVRLARIWSAPAS